MVTGRGCGGGERQVRGSGSWRRHRPVRLPAGPPARKGTDRVGTNGVTAKLMFCDRGTFWVFPLTYFDLPKSAGAYLFSQSIKNDYFCSGPISADPVCPPPSEAPARGASSAARFGFTISSIAHVCPKKSYEGASSAARCAASR